MSARLNALRTYWPWLVACMVATMPTACTVALRGAA